MKISAYAALNPKSQLEHFEIMRRTPGPHDVAIDIHYCGICHSDVHQVSNDWGGGSIFPMVPGHEIAGVVKSVGNAVSKFKVGDKVGIGCIVDSCRSCHSCKSHLEQYCEEGFVGTYNSRERQSKAPTYGGYSKHIVVDENYVLHIPEGLSLDKAAPLLCAGITTYSPLKHWQAGPGKKVAILGLGGLGHVALKLAKSLGAEVSVLSHSPQKEGMAKGFGADKFLVTSNPAHLNKVTNYFDLILCTVSSEIDWNPYLNLLKHDGTFVILGISVAPVAVGSLGLVLKRRNLAGSLIGGIQETQEMLNYCAKHKITPETELIPVTKINDAYNRMIKGDILQRFVIDIATLHA